MPATTKKLMSIHKDTVVDEVKLARFSSLTDTKIKLMTSPESKMIEVAGMAINVDLAMEMIAAMFLDEVEGDKP